MARMRLAKGVTLDVYNLHGEAGGCPADVEARLLGFLRLVEYIRTWSPGRPVIVAGDFNLRWNDPPDVAPLQMLLDDAGLTETCLALDCGNELVDKVFFRSSDSLQLQPVSWAVPPEFVSPEGAHLSDHEPVSVRFAWTETAVSGDAAGILHPVYPETVTVATLNLLHGLSDEDPQAEPYDRIHERRVLVGKDLSASPASLLALQEVSLLPLEDYPDVLGTMLSLLNTDACPACHAVFGPVGGTPPVFDGGDVVGQLTASRLPQSGPAHNRQVGPMRSVTHLRVDSSLGKIDFYNVHLEGSDEMEDGIEEANAFLAFVEETSRYDHIVVAAGYFNSHFDSAAVALILDAGFVDLAAQAGLECSLDDNTGCTASTLPLGEPGNRTSERIDYILLRTDKKLLVECAPRFSAPQPSDSGPLWPSDHVGLACALAPGWW